MPQPTEDIQYLRGLPASELIDRAGINPTPALAIALAEKLNALIYRPASAKRRIAPNHPAFLGA